MNESAWASMSALEAGPIVQAGKWLWILLSDYKLMRWGSMSAEDVWKLKENELNADVFKRVLD